ncbi:MAG TPA: hypothetical protein VND99_02050 [Candidatus Acidoferrales bacterium]|nr:hypothetical protein [Candidatus Acidoferrales bacterium]
MRIRSAEMRSGAESAALFARSLSGQEALQRAGGRSTLTTRVAVRGISSGQSHEQGRTTVPTLLNFIAGKAGVRMDEGKYSASSHDHPRRHHSSPRWTGGPVPTVKRMR